MRPCWLRNCRRHTVSVPSATVGYSVFALETRRHGEYPLLSEGKLQTRSRERMTVRGLSNNHNPEVKNLFKGAAISASTHPGPLYDFYSALLEKGMRPTMARLNPGAKDCQESTSTIWKKGGDFDATQLHRQEALSVCEEEAFPSPAILSGDGRSGSRDARVEEESI